MVDRKEIFVLGRGASGQAAEKLAKELGYGVTVCDDAAPLPPRETSFPEFAVVSPGLALTHPLVVECRERGIPLKSELQFGCEELKRRGWKLIAVTGSKGKSSVVKLCAQALGGIPCGNYGTPVCELAYGQISDFRFQISDLEHQPPTTNHQPSTSNLQPPTSNLQPPTFNLQPPTCPWAVVEVSSFQLETTELASDTFEAAAILNLQEDHLDRHGSVETYHALKRKLLTFTQHPFDCIAADDSTQAIVRGSYFDNAILRGNSAAAVALLRVAGLEDAKIRQAFKSFEPLPHRFQLVGEIDGVRYIDDSKATSLAALVAAVEMSSSLPHNQNPKPYTPNPKLQTLNPTPQTLNPKPYTPNPKPHTLNPKPHTLNPTPHTQSSVPSVLLIAGGLAKGDDPKTAVPVLTRCVKKVYLIGRCAEKFFAAWSEAVDCEICGTLERAVEAAKRDAQTGDTVLLSPGCASFDQFKSFGERGEIFASLVK